MKVYSLSGPSGTGKSTSALHFAYTKGIEGIIDDGLLIINGKRRAGTSAKFEKNTITAVRRAIFEDEAHRQEVQAAIKDAKLSSVLIIGTSDKMTKKIAKQLQLGQIVHFYYVENIRSAREIQIARFIRQTKGQHVMPIPYEQVEQNFFKRLVRKGRAIFVGNLVKVGETTIVQPDFHYETLTIHKQVYRDVLQHIIGKSPIVAHVEKIQFNIASIPKISATLVLKGPIHYDVITELRGLQQEIVEAFQRTFELEPERIFLAVKGIKGAGAV
ncbi:MULTISPECIES: hypothetical protein [Metasolibacillus]|uniref:hypothetical protein n=1 Tax=Metasolibacillus TaxID=2703677 RepID=UPI000796BBB0|nr:hypothetical protein [Metasolibacillus fluoroglycofenilyticus]KYG91853.1 hypothetical protein A0U40_02635 [[Bacillus] sp. KCTC 13219]